MKRKVLAGVVALLAITPITANVSQLSVTPVQAAKKTMVPKKFRGNWSASVGKAMIIRFRLTKSTFKGKLIFKGIEDQKIPYEASYDTVKPVVYKLTNQASSVGPNQASIKKLGKNKIMITTNQPGAVKMYITRGKATINGIKHNKVLNVRYNTSKTIPFTTDSFTNW